MSQPRNVPGIARGPQAFSQSAKRPIQSPMQPPPMSPAQQAMAAPFQTIPAPAEPVYSVEQDIQDLAMEIYAKLTWESITDEGQPHEDTLRQLASYSKIAARIFFEGQSSEKV